MLNQHSIILAAYLKFADVYHDFFNLPNSQQDQVFSSVIDSFKNTTWLQNHQNNILVRRINTILTRTDVTITKKPTFLYKSNFALLGLSINHGNVSYRLTWNEVVDCVGDAIGSAVFGGIVGAAQGVYNMIGGGGFSVGAIAKIARNSFKGLAWAAALDFGWCIITSTFDFSLSDLF